MYKRARILERFYLGDAVKRFWIDMNKHVWTCLTCPEKERPTDRFLLLYSLFLGWLHLWLWETPFPKREFHEQRKIDRYRWWWWLCVMLPKAEQRTAARKFLFLLALLSSGQVQVLCVASLRPSSYKFALSSSYASSWSSNTNNNPLLVGRRDDDHAALSVASSHTHCCCVSCCCCCDPPTLFFLRSGLAHAFDDY